MSVINIPYEVVECGFRAVISWHCTHLPAAVGEGKGEARSSQASGFFLLLSKVTRCNHKQQKNVCALSDIAWQCEPAWFSVSLPVALHITFVPENPWLCLATEAMTAVACSGPQCAFLLQDRASGKQGAAL